MIQRDKKKNANTEKAKEKKRKEVKNIIKEREKRLIPRPGDGILTVFPFDRRCFIDTHCCTSSVA
jgi:hypothetical protein